MFTKNRFCAVLRTLMCTALFSVAFAGHAEVDMYDIADMGYLRSPMEAKSGIVLTNNYFSEIYLLKDGKLSTMVSGRGCGIYTKMSKDKTLVGFKSINDEDMQAPAVLNVLTGKVTLLEEYSRQCGQVSFSDDGTMAYTVGNNLIIRKGEERNSYDLGFYTNIANISPDGTQVAYSNIDGRMFIINLLSGKSEQIDVPGGYDGVWSPDGKKLAVQTAQGTFSVLDRSDDKIYNIGKGVSVSWANNSNELVYTTIEGINEMQVTGSSIRKVNFDGTNSVALIASSEDMPTDAVITSDNKLLIPYSTGTKRGLMMRTLPVAAITPHSVTSVSDQSLFSISEESFGERLDDICDSPVAVRNEIEPKAFQQKIGALDIPYLSQIYDVPAVNGCTKWGYVACAPTSACMFLGYYGLLDPVALASRYSGKGITYYAYHVGSVYTNQAGTKTFSATASGNGCSSIPGAYGYMWNTASPQSHIENFMKLNGCTSAGKTYDGGTAWSKFQSEATAGRPYIICVKLGSNGHVILGFATNCKYRSATGFSEQTGSFVCHDPYGDYNDSYWADGDGQHSTYDWVGYNNGQGNIGVYYWSVYAIPSTTPVEPGEPKLEVDKKNITLTGVYKSSDVIYTDVKVTGELLSNSINVTSYTQAVKVSKLSDWNDVTGGTIRLTLNTNFRQGVGTYTNYVAVVSGEHRVEIGTTVNLTENGTNAIDNVSIDENVSVEYYNLQGVRVINPEKGIYIKRQDGKATKVVL
ncbi:MAG: C39 family peptidase [Muribaculaceae bacterium]|nr:C39 family peptidase [Muribaculaceae bacterium]